MLRDFRTLALVLSATVTSCVTTDITRGSEPQPSASEVRVLVCQSASIGHSHRPIKTSVHTRLLRIDRDSAVIHDSQEATWSVSDLPPGRYRLDVLGWQRPDGRVIQFGSPRSETFAVRPHESLEIHVILSDKRGWLYTALGHVLAGVSIAILSRHTK